MGVHPVGSVEGVTDAARPSLEPFRSGVALSQGDVVGVKVHTERSVHVEDLGVELVSGDGAKAFLQLDVGEHPETDPIEPRSSLGRRAPNHP